MANRHPNYRLVKIHRSYTVEETATLFGVHRNTVREWVKRGLQPTDGKRPMLIQGQNLVAFLKARRIKNKRPCGPGQIYCMRCRSPQHPAGEMADVQPVTASLGTLTGICPSCNSMMYRRINLAKLDSIRGKLDISFPLGRSRIGESSEPSVNSDLEMKEQTNVCAQP